MGAWFSRPFRTFDFEEYRRFDVLLRAHEDGLKTPEDFFILPVDRTRSEARYAFMDYLAESGFVAEYDDYEQHFVVRRDFPGGWELGAQRCRAMLVHAFKLRMEPTSIAVDDPAVRCALLGRRILYFPGVDAVLYPVPGGVRIMRHPSPYKEQEEKFSSVEYSRLAEMLHKVRKGPVPEAGRQFDASTPEGDAFHTYLKCMEIPHVVDARNGWLCTIDDHGTWTTDDDARIAAHDASVPVLRDLVHHFNMDGHMHRAEVKDPDVVRILLRHRCDRKGARYVIDEVRGGVRISPEK